MRPRFFTNSTKIDMSKVDVRKASAIIADKYPYLEMEEGEINGKKSVRITGRIYSDEVDIEDYITSVCDFESWIDAVVYRDGSECLKNLDIQGLIDWGMAVTKSGFDQNGLSRASRTCWSLYTVECLLGKRIVNGQYTHYYPVDGWWQYIKNTDIRQ